MSRLVLVRHGQSQWNLENRFTGWVDVPLSKKGIEEAISAGEKLKNFELKHIPRTSMRDKLPGFIYNLPKRGFPTPIKHWFRRELKSFVKDFILDNFKEIEFFNKSKIEKFISTFQNSSFTTPYDEVKAHRLWIILNLVIYNQMQSKRYNLS